MKSMQSMFKEINSFSLRGTWGGVVTKLLLLVLPATPATEEQDKAECTAQDESQDGNEDDPPGNGRLCRQSGALSRGGCRRWGRRKGRRGGDVAHDRYTIAHCV